jgi:hypothetical protein
MVAQRIEALQVSQSVVCFLRGLPDNICTQAALDALKAVVQSGTYVKREPGSPLL